MAAIAIVSNSQQMADMPALGTYPLTYLRPNESGGRVRQAFFYYAPTASQAAGVVIGLCKIPVGARIVEGKLISNGAVATAVANVGVVAADLSGVPDANTSDYDPGNGQSVLTADSGTFFATGLTIATAGAYSYADTYANNNGYVFQKDCFIIATLGTAGMTGATHILQGHVTYVLD